MGFINDDARRLAIPVLCPWQRIQPAHGEVMTFALVAALVSSALPPAPPPSPPPLHQQVEVIGYHGCWHTIAAIHAAKTLHQKGVVSQVTVRRAGSQHTPTFADEEKAAFEAYTAALPRTQHWDGQSPRIIIDGDPHSAMGCSPFLQTFAKHFTGPEDFGLPPMREDLWQMALTERALPLLAVAGLSKATGFFSVDPPGKPLRGTSVSTAASCTTTSTTRAPWNTRATR